MKPATVPKRKPESLDQATGLPDCRDIVPGGARGHSAELLIWKAYCNPHLLWWEPLYIFAQLNTKG